MGMGDPMFGMGGAPMQQPTGPFGGGAMTPEQIRAYLEYAGSQGAWSEQDRAIQQQLARANALQDKPQSVHTTGAGAAIGGMGDVLNAYMGAKREKQQRAADMELQQARIAALQKLAGAWPQQQQPDASIPPMLARPPGL